jgi:arsenite oxidase small subunit
MTEGRDKRQHHEHLACLTRRDALLAGAGGVAASMLVAPGSIHAQQGATTVDLAVYPEKRLGRASDLRDGEPVAFTYPLEAQPNFVVKLGVPAQGGVGPNRDIVAFSSLCTHMGGSLRGRYRHDVKAIGPCPLHFSTFDLTRAGIPVHASATQSLPQIILKAVGDELFAVGVMGLIYGYRHNLRDGTLADGAKASVMRG